MRPPTTKNITRLPAVATNLTLAKKGLESEIDYLKQSALNGAIVKDLLAVMGEISDAMYKLGKVVENGYR